MFRVCRTPANKQSHRSIQQDNPTGKSSFSLCFGLEAFISAVVSSLSTRNNNFGPQQNEQLLDGNLLLIEDTRKEVAKRDEHFKRVVARYRAQGFSPQVLKQGILS